MSYDISLVIDTGGPELATVCDAPGNYTSNVSGMWRFALGFPLRDLHGTVAGDAVAFLEPAVAILRDPANDAALRAMEPDNRWGCLEGATQYLADLLAACQRHPRASIHIWC